MKEVTLYSRRREGVTLRDALQTAFPVLEPERAQVIILLYSPKSCQIGRLTADGRIETASVATEARALRIDGDTSLTGVFEARCFGPKVELRWLHDADGLGTAVLLSESPLPATHGGESVLTCVRVLSQQYLLWGEGTDVDPTGGWSALAEARIGALPVPLEVKPHQRVCLNAREYMAIADRHGNVTVADERLTGLAILIDRSLNAQAGVSGQGEVSHG